MLKLDLILQIMNKIGHSMKEKIKTVIALMKDDVVGKIIIKIVGLEAKSYSYLIDDNSEDKKAKSTKCLYRVYIKFKIIKTV